MSERRKIIFEADPALVERVQQAADERGLSRNYLIARLLVEGLDALIPADEMKFTRKPLPSPRPPILGPIIGFNGVAPSPVPGPVAQESRGR